MATALDYFNKDNLIQYWKSKEEKKKLLRKQGTISRESSYLGTYRRGSKEESDFRSKNSLAADMILGVQGRFAIHTKLRTLRKVCHLPRFGTQEVWWRTIVEKPQISEQSVGTCEEDTMKLALRVLDGSGRWEELLLLG